MDKTEYLRAFLHRLRDCNFPLTNDYECAQAIATIANVVLNDNSVTANDVLNMLRK